MGDVFIHGRIAALALAAWFMVVGVTAAAADFQRAPRAMTAADLERYADVLGLSDEQRHAAGGEYERYLDEFEPLRADMMETAIRHPAMMRLTDEFTRSVPGFVRRVQELDAALFERIEPLLTDTQLETLPRVRSMRERAIYLRLGVMALFIGGAAPDLGELLDLIDAPPEVLAPLLPEVLAYEDRLTRGLRGVFDAAIRLCTTDDPNAADVMIERVRSLRAMNRAAYGRLAAALPEPEMRRLQREFFEQAYGNVLDSVWLYVLPQYEAALRLPDLSESQRDAILGMRREAMAYHDEMLGRLADLVDQEAIQPAPTQGAIVGGREYYELVHEMTQGTPNRSRELAAALHTLLGDRAAAVRHMVSNPSLPRSMGEWRYACGLMSFASRPRTGGAVEAPFWATDPLLAAPIGRKELTAFLSILGLDRELRDVIMTLYAEYHESLDRELLPLRRQTMNFMAFLRAEDRAGIDPLARARDRDALRREMRRKVEAADAAFLEDVRLVAGIDADDPRWQRVQRQRGRDAIAVRWLIRHDPVHAAEVDLMRLFTEAGLDGEWDAVEALAPEYESGLLERLQRQAEAVARISFFELAQRDGYRGDDHGDGRSLRNETGRAYRDLATFNQEMVERFAEALPDEAAMKLQDAFNRLAYPKAYEDPADMGPALGRALELPDLADSQRTRLTELRLSFLASMRSIRSGMIDACVAYTPWLSPPLTGRALTPEIIAAEEQFKQEIAKLTDERVTNNRRALRALRTTLAPAQLRWIELPELN